MPVAKKENHAFIDGQNLHSGVRAMGWKIDHKKFRDHLRDEFSVTKAFMFVGYMEEHQDLYNALQEAGFILFFKPLLRYEDGTIKGNVDADMVLQVMIDLENFDKAVIVTGDGDFAGLIRYLASAKKLEQVIIPNSRNFSSFFERMDEFGKDKHVFSFMDNMRSKLSYHPTKRPATPKSRMVPQGSAEENAAKSTPLMTDAESAKKATITKPAKRGRKPASSVATNKRAVQTASSATKRPAPTSSDRVLSKPKPMSSRPKPKSSGKPTNGRKRMTFKEKLESSLIDTINNAADI